MSYHHLALATKDMNEIHNFYETIMGFQLVKVEIAPINEGGWAKHFFYSMTLKKPVGEGRLEKGDYLGDILICKSPKK